VQVLVVGNAPPPKKARLGAEVRALRKAVSEGHVVVLGLEAEHSDSVGYHDLFDSGGFIWAWGELFSAP
jgi:hypothetical protein